MATLRATGRLELDGERIRPSALLADVYERRGFTQIWTDHADARALATFIGSVAADGLAPEHYNYATVARSDSVSGTAARLAELDLLRTHAALRAAYDLRFGRVDPTQLVTNWSLDRALWRADPIGDADSLLRSGRLLERARALRPTNFAYTGMVAAPPACARSNARAVGR